MEKSNPYEALAQTLFVPLGKKNKIETTPEQMCCQRNDVVNENEERNSKFSKKNQQRKRGTKQWQRIRVLFDHYIKQNQNDLIL